VKNCVQFLPALFYEKTTINQQLEKYSNIAGSVGQSFESVTGLEDSVK